jgi:hypothetical protein
LIVKWNDMFQDPDMVGQTEYLAIHDAVAVSVLGTEEPAPDRVLTEEERRQIQNMLDEFHRLIGELRGDLDRKVVGIPTDTVDWALLRRQKAEMVRMMMNKKTTRPLQDALEGIVGFLDDVQDRAATLLGDERVFGASSDTDTAGRDQKSIPLKNPLFSGIIA